MRGGRRGRNRKKCVRYDCSPPCSGAYFNPDEPGLLKKNLSELTSLGSYGRSFSFPWCMLVLLFGIPGGGRMRRRTRRRHSYLCYTCCEGEQMAAIFQHTTMCGLQQFAKVLVGQEQPE